MGFVEYDSPCEYIYMFGLKKIKTDEAVYYDF